MTQAFPLHWPAAARAKSRTNSQYRVTPAKAFDEMRAELQRFGATSVVISSNIPLRRDGTPYRDGLSELLDDPGVAVYFQKSKQSVCVPCDTFRRPWENIRAIGLSVKAFRDIERSGAHQVLNQMFRGFTALPSPDSVSDAPTAAWWVVLGVDASASEDAITAAFRARVRESSGATHELNAAREAGMTAARSR